MRTSLSKKFKPTNNFAFGAHIIKLLKATASFYLFLLPLNCVLSLSLSPFGEIFANEFWESRQVAISNISIALAMALVTMYVIFVQKEKSKLLKDFVMSVGVIHLIAVYAIHRNISVGFLMYLVGLGSVMSVVGTSYLFRKQQSEMIDTIKSIESTPRGPRTQVPDRAMDQSVESIRLREQSIEVDDNIFL